MGCKGAHHLLAGRARAGCKVDRCPADTLLILPWEIFILLLDYFLHGLVFCGEGHKRKEAEGARSRIRMVDHHTQLRIAMVCQTDDPRLCLRDRCSFRVKLTSISWTYTGHNHLFRLVLHVHGWFTVSLCGSLCVLVLVSRSERSALVQLSAESVQCMHIRWSSSNGPHQSTSC